MMDITDFDDDDDGGLASLIDQGLDGYGGFRYIEGELYVEKVPLSIIAAAVGTPTYVYSRQTLIKSYQKLKQAMEAVPAKHKSVRLCYAIKANSNQAVITTLAQQGAGADVVSLGEMERALAAGIPPEKIVFSGVGKTHGEIHRALGLGVSQINVESEPELRLISKIATGMGILAPIAVRINPDVDAKTHEKISTGRKDDKFGIDIDQASAFYQLAASLPSLKIQGIAVHIGSQLTDLAPFRAAFMRLADCVRDLRRQGHDISHIDLGGGLGVRYQHETPISNFDYAEMIANVIGPLAADITLEPGRSVAGPAGVLLSRVTYVKKGADRQFVILDAAMNDLLRPALYDAWHDIVPLCQPDGRQEIVTFDVVGPVCESGDKFASDRPMIEPEPGDLVAIGTAGAYGSAMSSNYNTRPLVAEVMVDGDRFALVRPRQSVDDIIKADHVPDWARE
jgi:diaminopimelate decarboxylase